MRRGRRQQDSEEARSVRILSRALKKLEAVDDPETVLPVEGEPEWVVQLAPMGRAFARLLLNEASPAKSKRRARSSR